MDIIQSPLRLISDPDIYLRADIYRQYRHGLWFKLKHSPDMHRHGRLSPSRLIRIFKSNREFIESVKVYEQVFEFSQDEALMN